MKINRYSQVLKFKTATWIQNSRAFSDVFMKSGVVTTISRAVDDDNFSVSIFLLTHIAWSLVFCKR